MMRARENRFTNSNIKNVDADTTHVLFASNTFPCRPLEGSNARVLDFVQVLDTLGDIDKQIGTSCVGTEAPNLAGVGNIPTELVGEDTSSQLEIVTRVDLAGFNGSGELFIDGQGLNEETIVLVLRLGKGDHA